MNIKCQWITCEHNSVDFVNEEFVGVKFGDCNFDGEIKLSSDVVCASCDFDEVDALRCEQYKACEEWERADG